MPLFSLPLLLLPCVMILQNPKNKEFREQLSSNFK